LDFAAVAAVSFGAAMLLWCKLQSLVQFDPGVWLEESLRFARGETPYRDFFWQYPPLGLAAIGYPLRFLGVSFSVAQTAMDVLSLGIVLLVFCLLGYLVPRALRIWICVLVIAVGATTQTYFSLFSLLSYSPALHTVAIGLLLMLLGSFRYLADGAPGQKLPKTVAVLLVSGCWIALMSKQEAFLVAPAFLFLLALFDPHTRGASRRGRWSRILAAGLLPPLGAYLLLGKAVGFANLSAALRGYGLATVPCPWWPTGLGVLGALAALGAAAFVVGAGSLFEWSCWRKALGARYILMLAAAAAGGVIWLGYEWHTDGTLLTGPSSLAVRVLSFSKAAFGASQVLRPVLWPAIIYWMALLVALIRGPVHPARLQLLLLLTVPVLISVRSLFGSTLAPTPEVPALSYPFLSLLGPYLLVRSLEFPRRVAARLSVQGHRVAIRIASTLVISYAILRVAAAYSNLLSNRSFTPLHTESGLVRVRDGNVNAALYRYVRDHTQPGDYFIELPYGGGLTFASLRRNPVFSNQFAQIPIPERFQLADLARIRNHPPSLIVAADEPNFGTFWGIQGNMACVFPHWTWIPDRPSWTPESALPLTQFIENNYHTDQKIGAWLLLRSNAR
jgi:hypothetical protein